MLAAMTHPSRVLNLDMKAKLCMPKSYIYIYIYIYIYLYTRFQKLCNIENLYYIYVCVYICVYMCVYIYICVYIYTHKYIYTHISESWTNQQDNFSVTPSFALTRSSDRFS